MANTRKLYTGVGLDPEVVGFLAELSRQTDRTRSWLINAIVIDHARRLRLEQEAKAAQTTGVKIPIIRM